MDQEFPTLLIRELPPLPSSRNDSASSVQIVAWTLEEVTFPFRRETILTPEPREVTSPEAVQLGGEYSGMQACAYTRPMALLANPSFSSGIFKLVSFFQDPYDRWHRLQGTAFGISDSDALTAAHNVCDPELGPAKMVAVLMDQRGDANDENARHCVATAVLARWITSCSRLNDFAMVTVAQSFGPRVRTHQYDTKPEIPESPESMGYALGFPYDFPEKFPGKHLSISRGKVLYHGGGDQSIIMHMANTESGK